MLSSTGRTRPVQERRLIRLTGGCVREHRPIQRETGDRQGARCKQTRGGISMSTWSWPRCTEPCPLGVTVNSGNRSLTLPSSSPQEQQRHCRSVANYHAATLHTQVSIIYRPTHTHTHTRKLTEGHNRPGKVESHVVDPKVQRLGAAVCHAVHARLVEIGQVV